MSLSDALMDAKNFNRYVFRTTITTQNRSVWAWPIFTQSDRKTNSIF